MHILIQHVDRAAFACGLVPGASTRLSVIGIGDRAVKLRLPVPVPVPLSVPTLLLIIIIIITATILILMQLLLLRILVLPCRLQQSTHPMYQTGTIPQTTY
jgi:hypothetical protein